MESGFNRMLPTEPAAGYQAVGLRGLESKWALGLESRAHPREIMTEVLKALQELSVSWKKIGHYNFKCRWLPSIPGHHEGVVNNPVHNNHYFGDESTIIENDGVIKLPNVVKFELQLYKTPEEKYLLDLQWVQGPPFLFLDLCAAFLAQLRVHESSIMHVNETCI